MALEPEELGYFDSVFREEQRELEEEARRRRFHENYYEVDEHEYDEHEQDDEEEDEDEDSHHSVASLYLTATEEDEHLHERMEAELNLIDEQSPDIPAPAPIPPRSTRRDSSIRHSNFSRPLLLGGGSSYDTASFISSPSRQRQQQEHEHELQHHDEKHQDLALLLPTPTPSISPTSMRRSLDIVMPPRKPRSPIHIPAIISPYPTRWSRNTSLSGPSGQGQPHHHHHQHPQPSFRPQGRFPIRVPPIVTPASEKWPPLQVTKTTEIEVPEPAHQPEPAPIPAPIRELQLQQQQQQQQPHRLSKMTKTHIGPAAHNHTFSTDTGKSSVATVRGGGARSSHTPHPSSTSHSFQIMYDEDHTLLRRLSTLHSTDLLRRIALVVNFVFSACCVAVLVVSIVMGRNSIANARPNLALTIIAALSTVFSLFLFLLLVSTPAPKRLTHVTHVIFAVKSGVMLVAWVIGITYMSLHWDIPQGSDLWSAACMSFNAVGEGYDVCTLSSSGWALGVLTGALEILGLCNVAMGVYQLKRWRKYTWDNRESLAAQQQRLAWGHSVTF